MIDSAQRPGGQPEQWQERILNDGSRHQIYKRYLSGHQLCRELNAELLPDGTWSWHAPAS